ncbi:MAG: hypothetical protein H0S78_05935 [Tissierellales bacterium]|jgi:hypothetical protein|nr:hypothetical protein [Tissierellales bacterium]HCX05062.1 hypothetical protein [Clostridiales bacterium]
MNHVLFSTIFNIGVVLFISLILIRKNYYVRGLKIFIFLFIIGQVLGYGLGVDILKSVIPSSSNPKSGVSYQIITSTILPLLLAFIAKDILNQREELKYSFFIKMMLLTLILIGLLQLMELPKVLDYILLVLAILLGSVGFLKKFKSSDD